MGGTEVTGLQASAHYEQLLKGPMEVRLSRRGYRGDSHSPNIVICVHRLLGWRLLVWAVATLCFCQSAGQAQLPLKYNHPNLTVDLGVGLWAWPLPMDWDGDGNLDLIVSCPDAPYNGTYFFKNLGGVGSDDCVFDAPVKVGPALKDVAVSHINGTPRVLSANVEYVDFLGSGFSSKKTLAAEKIVHAAKGRTRFNVWKYVDYNRDGLLDVMVGADDWGEYGWDDGFDANGRWVRGPLEGFVYVLLNEGTEQVPNYASAFRVQAEGKDVNVYGNPMPNFADFDGDGDDDLICAEFLDGFTYFENIAPADDPQHLPKFAAGRYLEHAGEKIHMHVQMITPSAVDWDSDGDVDLVCGDEDGRVALIENSGAARFLPPKYFQQIADDLKFGALVTPFGFDWDQDGDDDLLCGNTSGNIAWIENLDGGNPPKWSAPQLLLAQGQPIHIQAGINGSIQGPAERKWGYTTLSVADWNHDGLADIIVNSIWGKVVWYENIGSANSPRLAAPKPIEVEWLGPAPKPNWTWWQPQGKELVTQWRTTPLVHDWNNDGLNDLIMLDHEGYLALFQRFRNDQHVLCLMPPQRVFSGGKFDSSHNQKAETGFLQLNNGTNGGSGRRKLCLSDWDGDGLLDLLVNARNNQSRSIVLMRNMGVREGLVLFQDDSALGTAALAGHTTSPTVVDWDKNGIPDLVVGAEDGRLYYLPNPRVE